MARVGSKKSKVTPKVSKERARTPPSPPVIDLKKNQTNPNQMRINQSECGAATLPPSFFDSGTDTDDDLQFETSNTKKQLPSNGERKDTTDPTLPPRMANF